MTPEGLPETLEELCDYIALHCERIFVREEPTEAHPERTWALSELPAPLAIRKALAFVKEGRVPIRVRSDEEVAALKR